MAKHLITCDCLGTQTIDAAALSAATGLDVRPPCSALCTTEIERAAQALTAGDAIFCCAQEARRFDELAEELGREPAPVLDLRDRAGWTSDSADLVPKMSALMAEAMLPAESAKTVDVVSEGLCLILGPAEVALDAAARLKDYLGVTVLLDAPSAIAGAGPDGTETGSAGIDPAGIDPAGFDVVSGTLRQATGSLGQFRVVIDGLRSFDPGGRGDRPFSAPRDGGVSECDVIVDLRGGTPLFPAPEKREGYLRAEPTYPPAVSAAILAASHLVGTFEQPLYVKAEPALCAHSRAEQTGCTRCLDLCPTGAITPAGEHVTVDPLICAGCGACSAACPSGAISYDAPPVELTFRRIQTLAKAYLDAGGQSPRLLVVNDHGRKMISLAARHGRGLPADVIPLEMAALNAFGHAEAVAALAAGFGDVTVLPAPGTDRDALQAQVALAGAIGGVERVRILDTEDPDALSEALFAVGAAPATVSTPVRPVGTRRQITRQAAQALHGDTDAVPLPDGAPYGAVLVNTEACTLCLSCVSLCPTGALGDNSDLPQLRFQEDACLQCGICSTICPEAAITYEPRLNLARDAFSQVVLNEEEPFPCVECGSLFGSKSAIDRITEKLSAHPMFADPDRARLIQMCDDCRVNAQYHAQDNPFQGGERPRVRTTDDYFSKRRDH